MPRRHWGGTEESLGGIPFEQSSTDATASPTTLAATVTVPQATASGSDVVVTPDPTAATVTVPAPTAQAGSTPTPSPVAVVATLPSVFVSDGSDIIGDWTAQVTLFPERVAATVSAEDASASHLVVAGVSSRTAGAAAVLVGDYAFRGLYALTTDTDTPANFVDDAVGWVTLGRWGDFTLRLRREIGDLYSLRADWVTAASDPTWATGIVTLTYDQHSLGLGATRDAATGTIELWRSDDGWTTWSPVLVGSDHDYVAGALADSVPEDLELLAGDLADGPWISVFQAQWGATTDITDVDTDEVAAWNYGASIVAGVGGDFYDTIDADVLDAWEFGQNPSYEYKMRSQTTDAGTTVRVDWTVNAPTLATGDPTAGTEAAFTLDMTPQWESGPGVLMLLPPLQFVTTSTLDALIEIVEPGGFGDYTDTGERPDWRAITVNRDGTTVDVLEHAQIDRITWSLNEPEAFEFDLPSLDPAVRAISTWETEVQIWRGTRLIVWGVVVRRRTEGATVTYQCAGLGAYFRKRRIGGPRVNWVTDPSFETGAGFWFHGGYHIMEPLANRNTANWTSQITSERSVAGFPGRSLRLSSTDDMVFGIQSFTFIWHEIDPVLWPDGVVWTAAAWCYIPSEGWEAQRPAAYISEGDSTPAGLHLLRSSTTEFVSGPGGAAPKLYEAHVASIDDDTPKDTWHRLEVSLTQPIESPTERRTDWIQVELHCPIGVVFWDEVTLARNDRLFFNDEDQATIALNLVAHAQDTTLGKSDLAIGSNCPLTGVTRSRTYEYANRSIIADLLNEFPDLWDGMDWSVETTKDTRFFTTHFPMKGTRRPTQALVLNRNIARVNHAEDGEIKATAVTVQSDFGGTGSSREEARYADDTADPTLEVVLAAVPESPLGVLGAQAESAWRQRQDARIPTLTTYENRGYELLGRISTGDVVPVNCSSEGEQLVGEFRIMSLTLYPATESMDITVNHFDDVNDPALGGV